MGSLEREREIETDGQPANREEAVACTADNQVTRDWGLTESHIVGIRGFENNANNPAPLYE